MAEFPVPGESAVVSWFPAAAGVSQPRKGREALSWDSLWLQAGDDDIG